MDHKREPIEAEASAELPALCYSVHPTSGDAVMIRRGVLGFFGLASEWARRQPWVAAHVRECVDELNAELGVTAEVEQRMVAASMFGWPKGGRG